MSAWVKVETAFLMHPKSMRLSNEAIGVWLRTLLYVKQQGTGGVVSRASVKLVCRLVDDDVINELVDARLWDIVGDDDVRLHDYYDVQIASAAERGRLGGLRSAEQRLRVYGTAQPIATTDLARSARSARSQPEAARSKPEANGSPKQARSTPKQPSKQPEPRGTGQGDRDSLLEPSVTQTRARVTGPRSGMNPTPEASLADAVHDWIGNANVDRNGLRAAARGVELSEQPRRNHSRTSPRGEAT